MHGTGNIKGGGCRAGRPKVLEFRCYTIEQVNTTFSLIAAILKLKLGSSVWNDGLSLYHL
jgi:hypothetical protein